MRPTRTLLLELMAYLGLVLSFGLSDPEARAQDVRGSQVRPQFLVHYMPWFESKPVGGSWGWHWTMDRFDPERADTTGRRDIASHYYPLIGPYDSADPDVLEYHTLLMRVAGIDGVIADWYGSEDFNDYAMIHRRTALLFDATRRRGLKFAVCYEDRVLKAMAERDKLTPAQAVEHGKTHLRFCERTGSSEPSYVTLEGKPLLLVFGPDYLDPTQWEAVLSGMRRPPAFFSLHERRPPAIGSFAWPPMWASKDGVLDAKGLDAYLDRFYGQDGPQIGCAFPGFHDIYKEAGVQPSHGFLDRPRRRDLPPHPRASRGCPGARSSRSPPGTTSARGPASSRPANMAIATWRRSRTPGDCGLASPYPFRPDDLRLPLRIFALRKKIAPSSHERKILDEAVDLLFAADSPGALQRIAQVEGVAPQPSPRAK